MTDKKSPRGVVCRYFYKGMYARIVGSGKIKIKDSSLFIIRNH